MKDGLIIGEDGKPRCWWCGNDEDYVRYHDEEWGHPVADDTRLFEKLCLEGFQAGLSWLTILRKRENFRRAFAGFDIEAVAQFSEKDVERLLQDAGIVRHRGKIEATINNAQKALALQNEFGSLAKYFWQFAPKQNAYISRDQIPSETQESRALSQDLRKRGFKFIGPTTMYALMQAMGLVNDHLQGCFMYDKVGRSRIVFKRP